MDICFLRGSLRNMCGGSVDRSELFVKWVLQQTRGKRLVCVQVVLIK